MLKKILYLIFFIIIFTQTVFSQEVFRITSVNFDTSNSLIFLTSPDNTTETIMKNIKLIKLQNPKRVYFDINSAVLTGNSQNWFLNSNGLKQVKINQFSTNPNKIRVVLYLDEDFDQSKIKFLKVNNNIVIQFKNGICKNEYFQNIYRDERTSGSDFYENLAISSEDTNKIKTAADSTSKDDMISQIQQSFAQSASNVKPVSNTSEITKKEMKLKSKYYLNLISPKTNGFLVSGFGAISIEKPMYLTNPARVVFDIPNAIINKDIINQEFKIGQDTVKAAQFDTKKVRIVITSNQLEKYFPVFSSDGQSILVVNSDTIDYTSIFDKTNDVISYQVKKTSLESEDFIIGFNYPVVHSLRRDDSKLTINFYNTLRYNEKTFKDNIKNTGFDSMNIDLLPKVGLKLTLPLEKNYVINTYLGADGKTVKVSVKGLKCKTSSSDKNIILPRCDGKKSVVLDAGHGGSDYGAIREGINEKDINLDVAKRIQSLLENKGVTVYMTRENDETVSLQDRTIISANKNPDIFVSIHVNSSLKPEINGIETHYYTPSSLELSQTIHECLVSNLNSKDRGIFKSRFYVINHTNVPAVLVEIGFMSNNNERIELINEKRKQQTAKAIAEGILKYLNNRK